MYIQRVKQINKYHEPNISVELSKRSTTRQLINYELGGKCIIYYNSACQN